MDTSSITIIVCFDLKLDHSIISNYIWNNVSTTSKIEPVSFNPRL